MWGWPIAGLPACDLYLVLDCTFFWHQSDQLYLFLAKPLLSYLCGPKTRVLPPASCHMPSGACCAGPQSGACSSNSDPTVAPAPQRHSKSMPCYMYSLYLSCTHIPLETDAEQEKTEEERKTKVSLINSQEVRTINTRSCRLSCTLWHFTSNTIQRVPKGSAVQP